MLEHKQIILAGGDQRSVTLSRLLAQRNEVYTVGLETAEGVGGEAKTVQQIREIVPNPDYILLPMPAADEAGNIIAPFAELAKPLTTEAVISMAGLGTHILGGKLTEPFKKRMELLRLTYTDYLLREELAVKNAVPTAEGAIQIAMEELAATLWGMEVLIIGYGRIGKVLAQYLKPMGAKVTVSARRFSDLAWIEVNGYTPVHTCELEPVLPKCHLIFNTVPSVVLNEELLQLLPRSCLVIDLASKPGGVDFNTAQQLGIKTIWALSLPGKVAPVTAGRIIYDTLQNIDSERRYSLE